MTKAYFFLGYITKGISFILIEMLRVSASGMAGSKDLINSRQSLVFLSLSLTLYSISLGSQDKLSQCVDKDAYEYPDLHSSELTFYFQLKSQGKFQLFWLGSCPSMWAGEYNTLIGQAGIVMVILGPWESVSPIQPHGVRKGIWKNI